MKQFETNFLPKNAKKKYCEKCDFICSKESNWKAHILTAKHKNETNETCLVQHSCHKIYVCENCEKICNSRTTLWRHKNKCSVEQIPTNNNVKNFEIDKEMMIKLLLKNQDVMEKMMEIIPSIGNHSHNMTNSHNTQNFNIQMFLNDHCKNAMNLTDFIDTLPITAETYDNTIENGLTQTITSMITNGLSQLDILERPIHCTDATRKILYVKEENIWEKDTELIRMLLGIKTLARKQRNMIHEWKDANKGWEKDEIIQMKFTNLICNSMTDIENDEKETGKIIRSISKNTYLSNQVKTELTMTKV